MYVCILGVICFADNIDNFQYFSWFWGKKPQIFVWFHMNSVELEELGVKRISQFITEVKHDSVKCLKLHCYRAWIFRERIFVSCLFTNLQCLPIFRCQIHRGEKLAFYCETLEILLCNKCLLENKHNGHNYRPTHEVCKIFVGCLFTILEFLTTLGRTWSQSQPQSSSLWCEAKT